MPPVDTTRPLISGQRAVGAVLHESPGTWSGRSPISFAYQWYLCKVIVVPGGHGKPGYSTLAPCQPIPRATEATYTLTTADKNSDVYATVTASNADGSAHADPADAAVVPPTSYLGPGPYGADPLWALPRNVPSVPWILSHGGVTGSYNAPSAGHLDITWTGVLNGKSVLVAKAHTVFRRRGWQKVKTRLTKRGRAALARNYLLAVDISGSFTPGNGGAPSSSSSLTPIVF